MVSIHRVPVDVFLIISVVYFIFRFKSENGFLPDSIEEYIEEMKDLVVW